MRINLWLTLLFLTIINVALASPPPDPVYCTATYANYTISSSYGVFSDRSICYAGRAAYPRDEEELVAAVAEATARKQKMKVVTISSHSTPPLACPGGDDGLIISTEELNHVIQINKEKKEITVETGLLLRDLISEAARAGLALPHAPNWWGLTIGGLLSTGAHGSSLWGKGSAVHEYVIGMRIVTPAPAEKGYARVRVLDDKDPHLDAARVSLGVLGAISQVTLKLQPMFKRSVTYVERDDSDMAELATTFGKKHEFADITWLPSQGKAIYRVDDRVPINITGNGINDYIGLRATSADVIVKTRLAEEYFQASSNLDGLCSAARQVATIFAAVGHGFTNDGESFTGYPVVGYQNRMMASGTCINGPEDDLLTVCSWDPRIHGLFLFTVGFSISISKLRDFIIDIQKLRDLNPKSLCGSDFYFGMLMRYVKASTSYLGKQEDCLEFDISSYRSRDPSMPTLHEDVIEEIEQMALFKYGALPHWGKNRNFMFDGVIGKYSEGKAFIKVKNEFDPDGLFSNEWTDRVLGIEGKPSVYNDGCALEGLCICSEDVHCAPETGYLCRPGKVFKAARVCTFVG